MRSQFAQVPNVAPDVASIAASSIQQASQDSSASRAAFPGAQRSAGPLIVALIVGGLGLAGLIIFIKKAKNSSE